MTGRKSTRYGGGEGKGVEMGWDVGEGRERGWDVGDSRPQASGSVGLGRSLWWLRSRQEAGDWHRGGSSPVLDMHGYTDFCVCDNAVKPENLFLYQ